MSRRPCARQHGAYWQTHLSEDGGEMEEVMRLFPRRPRLSRRLRRGRRPRRADHPRARHPPVGPRGRAARGERLPGRALPGVEPVPVQRDDAPRRVPGGGHDGRAGERRRRRSGGLDLRRHAGRRRHAARRWSSPAAPIARRCAGSPRLAADGRRSTERGPWASRGASAHWRWARRPTSSPSTRGSRRRFRTTIRLAARTTSPAGSSSGRTRTWCAAAWVRGRLLAGPPGLDGIG